MKINSLAKWSGLTVSLDIESQFEFYSFEERGIVIVRFPIIIIIGGQAVKLQDNHYNC